MLGFCCIERFEITIWKPRLISGIEFVHGDNEECNNMHTVVECFSFAEIKQKCIKLLGTTLTSCTDLSEGSSIEDFVIPV